jgi:glucose/arabinose dehydrogenase
MRSIRPLAVAALLLLFALLVGARHARAATLPDGFQEHAVASGLRMPTSVAIARDGRVFITEQEGRLRVVASGRLQARPFLSLQVDAHGERGLLGVALHPDFPATPYVYVYYTATRPTVHNRVSRFTARGNRAAARSEVRLLDLPALGPTNHNGGGLHFGGDGMLYIGVGENGTPDNAQSLATPLGKMLRITPTGGVPADNPFLDRTTGTARAIWALGLRNPFTFAFARDGRVYIDDVGQDLWEEIDLGIAGGNYGWPLFEGYHTEIPDMLPPIFAYGHGDGPTLGCAITGGSFYEVSGPGAFPADFAGSYFFADLCNGWIRRLLPGTTTAVDFAHDIGNPVGLAVDTGGALYYVAYGEGRVVRVTYASSRATR